jgi:hypothetical protein
MMRFGLLIVVVPLLFQQAWAAPEGKVDSSDAARHLVSPTTTESGAVTLERFNQRIESDAIRFKNQRPGSHALRSAPFDTAWPLSDQEYAQLHGYGVVLVSATAWDAEELPLAKVYLVHPDGAQTPLLLVGHTTRTVEPSSAAATVYGPNREDSFYLVPIESARDAQLECDFAKNRTGFILSAAALPPPGYNVHAALPSSALPPSAVVQQLLDREYPGFGITASDPPPP